jgi:hypothetical protein
MLSFWETGDANGSTFQISHFPSDELYFMVTSQTALYVSGRPWMQQANVWHHVVGVFDGATIRLYVDGVDVMDPVAVPAPLDVRRGDFFLCQGGSSNPAPVYPWLGAIDEIAVWKRALSPAEIRGLYARGAGRLAVQVRGCEDPACEGVPFVGPDGTSATAYSEDASSAAAPPEISLAPARYVQWTMTLTRSDAAVDPQLASATFEP